MLYIDPDTCTECGACESECPTEAIFHQDNVPEPWRPFIALNAEMAAVTPSLVTKKRPLASS